MARAKSKSAAKQSQRKSHMEEKEVKKVVTSATTRRKRVGKREASTSATGSDAMTTGTTT